MTTRFYRYPNLVERGIVANRMTLSRWIATQGFPKPVPLGPNTRAWIAEEVDAWLAARADARNAPNTAA
jgi:prophage regulatory protein